MSNFRFRRLQQFQTGGSGDSMELSLPLPKSPRGRVLRYCPNEECAPRRFQLGDAPSDQMISDDTLVRRTPKTTGTTCPYCGSDDEDQSFNAPEDLENAQRMVAWAAQEDVSDWLKGMARGFNRSSPKGGLISLKMDVKSSSNPRPYAWREDLLRGLTCDICGRDYGVYAIALFCPDCGGRNIHVHFGREVQLVEHQVELSKKAADDGDDELGFRLLGNAHEDVVTALETYLRTVFFYLARTRLKGEALEKATKEARRGNPFQSLERSRKLFSLLGLDPFSVLSPEDLTFLSGLIEKRHVIGHNLGLADEKYLQNAGDGAEGENVRLLGDEVVRFAQLAFKVVVVGLESAEPEFLPTRN